MDKTKSPLIFLSILILLFFAFSCEQTSTNLAKNIVVSFDTAKALASRTISPIDPTYLDIEYFVFEGYGPLNSSFSEIIYSNGCTLEALNIGKWHFEVTSYNSKDRALSKGFLVSTIKKDTNSVTLVLDSLVGKGSINLQLSFNSDQIYGNPYIKYLLKDTNFNVVDSYIDQIEENQSTSSVIFDDIDSNSYILEATLVCDDQVVSALVESVRVIDNESSIATRELVIGQLASESIISVINNTSTPITGYITLAPLPTKLNEEATLTFNLDESSPLNSENLNYQWYCDGLILEDSNSNIYTIESLQGGTCRYDVVVSLEQLGSVGSATILVTTPVEITFN